MAETSVPDPGRTFVLNALTDVLCEHQRVLVDDRSRSCIESAVAETLADRTRGKLQDVVTRHLEPTTGEIGAIPDSEQEFLYRVAERVAATLAARDVEVTFYHEAPVSIAPRNAKLYTFMNTRDPNAIRSLEVSPTVSDGLVEGAKLATEGAFEEASVAFEAETGAGTHRDTRIAKVLTAWAAQEAGNDEAAITLVREILETDPEMWPAKLVGAAADHSSSALFRDGRLAKQVYIRSRLEPPDETAIAIDVGAESDTAVDWFDVSGNPRCLLVPRLTPDLRLRFRLSGALSDVPNLQMYYMAAGIVDTSELTPRSVEHELADGPVTADAHETLRFEPSE